MKTHLPPTSLLLASLGVWAAGSAWACGPFFPNSYLNSSEADLLQAPPGSFKAEITRLAAQTPASLPWKTIQAPRGTGWSADTDFLLATRATVLQAEADDLRAALSARGDTASQAQAIMDGFVALRRQWEDWHRRHQDSPAENGMDDKAGLPPAPTFTMPAGLPAEFERYFQGVLAWDTDKKAEAVKIWTDLLALPFAQRHYRSTWAVFMLARYWAEECQQLHWVSSDQATIARAHALEYSHQVRTLAGEGYPDPLGLAEASLGWEAKAELAAGNYDIAINLYLAQQSLGDNTALESLRRAAAAATSGNDLPQKLAALARNSTARGVITAYLVARGGSLFADIPDPDSLAGMAGQWAVALNKTGAHDQPEADRLAWVAYQGGQFNLARQWAALAEEHSPVAEWIRAQLALRAGGLAEGEKHLRSAVATTGLSDSQKVLIYAELGRVCLAQNQVEDALGAWLAGGHFEDASYLAERVLKLDELKAYVDANCPEGKKSPTVSTLYDNEAAAWMFPGLDQPAGIRHILARRLVRADRVDEAAVYFPENLRQPFHDYVAGVRTGFDPARPAAERAAALWTAAQIARRSGLELLGTELEPDWAIWDGQYETTPAAAQRLELAHAAPAAIWSATPEEIARVQAAPVPGQRFHYRYRAADLAWWAASLLPNDSAETAKILNEAGGWLKNRDPQAADKFYKALVIRCGNTELGRAAAKAHWFPGEKTPANSQAGARTMFR